MTTDYTVLDLPRAYAAPLTGQFRTQAQDFIVEEQMDIALTGTGEHLWVQVCKTDSNTDWVATQLGRAAGIAGKEVGYAGLKDRHAVTTQWFSLQLPGKADPDFSALPPEIEILQQCRHDRKLRRGAHTGNRFVLTLRECSGDFTQAAQVCEQIAQGGIPNYYGEQRFGHHNGNVSKAERWFNGSLRPKNRSLSSIYLSAARSWVFNAILAQRVRNGTWNQRVAGDIFMFDNSNAWFADDNSDALNARLSALEIHPTGALWGRGTLATQADTLTVETAQVAQFPDLCAGLERNGLQQERRALRIKVRDLQLETVDDTTLRLQFALPASAYATVVLNEFGDFHDASEMAKDNPNHHHGVIAEQSTDAPPVDTSQ